MAVAAAGNTDVDPQQLVRFQIDDEWDERARVATQIKALHDAPWIELGVPLAGHCDAGECLRELLKREVVVGKDDRDGVAGVSTQQGLRQ
jgi:hypothetical protein